MEKTENPGISIGFDSGNLEKNLDAIQTIISTTSEKYAMPVGNIVEMLRKLANDPLRIPSCIFRNSDLGILEALVKYLKEQKEMTYHEIAVLLNRDDRMIWVTYNKACKKIKGKIAAKGTNIWVPVSVFSSSRQRPLACLLRYLASIGHDHNFSANLLNRNPKSLWESYKRAIKK